MRTLPKLTVFALAVVGAQKVIQSYMDRKADKILDAKVDAAFPNTHNVTTI